MKLKNIFRVDNKLFHLVERDNKEMDLQCYEFQSVDFFESIILHPADSSLVLPRGQKFWFETINGTVHLDLKNQDFADLIHEGESNGYRYYYIYDYIILHIQELTEEENTEEKKMVFQDTKEIFEEFKKFTNKFYDEIIPLQEELAKSINEFNLDELSTDKFETIETVETHSE